MGIGNSNNNLNKNNISPNRRLSHIINPKNVAHTANDNPLSDGEGMDINNDTSNMNKKMFDEYKKQNEYSAFNINWKSFLSVVFVCALIALVAFFIVKYIFFMITFDSKIVNDNNLNNYIVANSLDRDSFVAITRSFFGYEIRRDKVKDRYSDLSFAPNGKPSNIDNNGNNNDNGNNGAGNNGSNNNLNLPEPGRFIEREGAYQSRLYDKSTNKSNLAPNEYVDRSEFTLASLPKSYFDDFSNMSDEDLRNFLKNSNVIVDAQGRIIDKATGEIIGQLETDSDGNVKAVINKDAAIFANMSDKEKADFIKSRGNDALDNAVASTLIRDLDNNNADNNDVPENDLNALYLSANEDASEDNYVPDGNVFTADPLSNEELADLGVDTSLSFTNQKGSTFFSNLFDNNDDDEPSSLLPDTISNPMDNLNETLSSVLSGVNAQQGIGNSDRSEYQIYNNQEDKLSYLSEGGSFDIGNKIFTTKEYPQEDYFLIAGTFITLVLNTAISTDIPGIVKATVESDVLDSIYGRYILIPKGSWFLGQYSTSISPAQKRVIVNFNVIYFPDGSKLVIDGIWTGLDIDGSSGIPAKVDTHWESRLKIAFIVAALNTGTDSSLQLASDYADELTGGNAYGTILKKRGSELSADVNDIGLSLIKPLEQTQPTLFVKIGTRFKLMTPSDLYLDLYNKTSIGPNRITNLDNSVE